MDLAHQRSVASLSRIHQTQIAITWADRLDKHRLRLVTHLVRLDF